MFNETDVTWTGPAAALGTVVANNVQLDPWLISVGVGYRFNLFDRGAPEPLK